MITEAATVTITLIYTRTNIIMDTTVDMTTGMIMDMSMMDMDTLTVKKICR